MSVWLFLSTQGRGDRALRKEYPWVPLTRMSTLLRGSICVGALSVSSALFLWVLPNTSLTLLVSSAIRHAQCWSECYFVGFVHPVSDTCLVYGVSLAPSRILSILTRSFLHTLCEAITAWSWYLPPSITVEATQVRVRDFRPRAEARLSHFSPGPFPPPPNIGTSLVLGKLLCHDYQVSIHVLGDPFRGLRCGTVRSGCLAPYPSTSFPFVPRIVGVPILVPDRTMRTYLGHAACGGHGLPREKH